MLLDYFSVENKKRREIFYYSKLLFKDNSYFKFNNKFPKIYYSDIEIYNWGFIIPICISKVCDTKIFLDNFDFIKHYFRAFYLFITDIPGYIFLKVVDNPIVNLSYSFSYLDNFKLKIGYDFFGDPIFIDMKKTPHVAIQGLSNMGKTSLLKCIIKNLSNSDKILINAFNEDFKEFNIKNIIGEDYIISYLDNILNFYYRNKPLYIFVDEFNSLIKNKKINSLMQDILSKARHYNIFLVCVGQILLKENCSFKQLFNTRITFRMLDKSTINAFLGVNLEDVTLNRMEFICNADSIYFGKTYLI